MDIEDDARISSDEIVLRRVPEDSKVSDNKLNRIRPSTQAFLQDGPDGLVSVYLNAETTPNVVAEEGPEPFLASIRVGVLRQLGLGLIRDSSSGGPGHCVITGRKTKGRLNQIVQQAVWVDGYAPK